MNKFLKLISLMALTTLSSLAFASNAMKTVAITQIVDNPALNEAKRGAIEVLQEAGFRDGDNIKLIEETAQGNVSIAVQIANKLASIKPDVIVPISTISAQTVLSKIKNTNIPMVFCSVTDPASAGLAEKAQVTGATDFPPLDDAIIMMKQFVPNLKRLGVIYSSGESNAIKIVELLKSKATDLQIVEVTVASSNDVSEAAKSFVGKVDAIYSPADNTIHSALKSLIKVTNEAHIPVFATDPDTVKQGVLAGIGYTQYDVGHKAGEMVAAILNGTKPEDIKIASPEKRIIFANQKTAAILGISIAKKVVNQEVTIIDGDVK